MKALSDGTSFLSVCPEREALIENRPIRQHRTSQRHYFWQILACFVLIPFLQVRGQWLPPAVSIQDPNIDGNLVLVNSSNVPYGMPAGTGASASYSAMDSNGDGWMMSLSWNGSQYVYSYADSESGETVGDGTYDPSSYLFSVSTGATVTGVDLDGSAWPPATLFGPPAVLVNGALWTNMGAYTDANGNTCDSYGDQNGGVLLLTSNSFSLTSASYGETAGSYSNGVMLTWDGQFDLRSVDTSGNLLTPSYGPSYGPPAVSINGSIWKFIGTITGYNGNLASRALSGSFDMYMGQQTGQYLLVRSDGDYDLIDWYDGFYQENYYSGLFYTTTLPVICPANADGSTGTSSSYGSLWVNGSQWSFALDINGVDVFSGLTGQYLLLNASSGSVVVADPYSVGLVNGTYSMGNFSVSGEDIQTSDPATMTQPHINSAYGYDQFWINGIQYAWASGYTNLYYNNSYDFYVGADGSSLNYTNGQFSPAISGDVELSNPDHSSSAFGYAQIWYNSTAYTWTWGYTDNQGNNYDYYSDANGNLLSDINNSFAGMNIWTSPPPPPPTSPLYGPLCLWVNGTIFQWSNSSVGEDSSGVDNYFDGFGDALALSSSGGVIAVSWTTTNNQQPITGTYDPETQLFAASVDIRASDTSGNIVYKVAPQSVPSAVRVDAPTPVWKYLGATSATEWSVVGSATMTMPVYVYAGSLAGQRLIIDSSTPSAQVVVVDSNSSGYTTGAYFGGAFWTDSRDLRAESIGGSPIAPPSLPSQGPGSVWVSGTLWSYMGTWTGGSYWGASSPQSGDYYVGANAGQRICVNSDSVTLWINNTSASGAYSNGRFSISGYSVFAGDSSGDVLTPVVGPTAVWVDGVIFTFMPSSRDPVINQDTYGDGSGNTVVVTSTTVAGQNAAKQSLWSGSYIPNVDPTQPGIFQISSAGSAWYDVRPFNQTSPLQNTGHPQSGHPVQVKVNGVNWSFQGQTGDSSTILDYYYGSQDGQCLVIDANNNVEVWTSTASFTPVGTGFLNGTVFVMTGVDIRALDSSSFPVVPSGAPAWGPPDLWADGLTYVWLGTVTGDSQGINADYYGGPNVGQIISVDSSSHVVAQNSSSGVPSTTGTYQGGVFAVPNADIRALTSSGGFQGPSSPPLYGDPNQLRVGGLAWNYIGSANGQNYYASNQAGQRLSIDANGNLVYSDWPDKVMDATGSYRNGIFTAGTGGTSYNAGTVLGDLDILGSMFSLGSWSTDPRPAGLTLSYRENSGTDGLYTASVDFVSSRAKTTWSWAHSSVDGSSQMQSAMDLDAGHSLNLYAPGSNSAAIVLNPAAQATFNVPIHVAPQGDLSMGQFTQTP